MKVCIRNHPSWGLRQLPRKAEIENYLFSKTLSVGFSILGSTIGSSRFGGTFPAMLSSKRSLPAAPNVAKRIKCEPLDISPLECVICFESIRGRGETVNALECGLCRVVAHGECVEGGEWSKTCPQCARETMRQWRREGPGEDDEVIVIDDDQKEDGEEEEEEEEKQISPNKMAWHFCGQAGCDYRTKRKVHLKRHGADVHDIGVAWHNCEPPGCDYRAKQKAHLNRHGADVHDIGVEWHYCEHPGCEFRSKRRGNIKRHGARVHI